MLWIILCIFKLIVISKLWHEINSTEKSSEAQLQLTAWFRYAQKCIHVHMLMCMWNKSTHTVVYSTLIQKQSFSFELQTKIVYERCP